MTNTTQQYEKYKDKFKFQSMIGIAAGAAAVVSVIMLLFIPILQVRMDPLVLEFSLFGEMIAAFKGLFSGSGFGYEMIFDVYQIFAIVYIVAGVAWQVVVSVKEGLSFLDPDTYAMEQYDKIKRTPDYGRKVRGNYNPGSLILSGIIFEIIYIVFGKALGSHISFGGNISSVNGVSWTIMFPILFIVGWQTLKIIKDSSYKKVKIAILKEDYGVASQTAWQGAYQGQPVPPSQQPMGNVPPQVNGQNTESAAQPENARQNTVGTSETSPVQDNEKKE